LSDEAKDYIIDKGYNPDYGARPLRRAIENMIEDPLAEEILRGTFKGKDTITVRIEIESDVRQIKFDATSSKDEPAQALAGVGGESGAAAGTKGA
ncbi:MAG: NDP-hexose 4-ketoreductase, partial [Isosphaeraceae bacterium]|nr:NDP-hexose 4-ketoreductase [Isosphaeraceae bacterium]